MLQVSTPRFPFPLPPLAEYLMPAHSGLQLLDYLAVVGYLLITIGIAYWSSRKQENTQDFFLGGRTMPWFAVGLSIMATMLSTITYLGGPGEMIRYGIAAFAGYLAIPFAAFVIIYLWIPFFMRLRMTSAYEYLENRFDSRVRLMAGILFLFLRLGWMAMVVYTASLAMVQMTRTPLYALVESLGFTDIPSAALFLVIGATGLAATVYTCIGGMRALIWTDVIQSVMLFGGVFVIIFYVASTTGTGPATWWQRASLASPEHTHPIFFSGDITVRNTIVWTMLSVFFWNICTHCSDQVVLQRYFTTNSHAAARNSFITNVISMVAIALLLSLSGLALLYFYLEHPKSLPAGMNPLTDSDKVMPYFYAHQLPAGLGGLVLASFLCDAMQTLVSGVNSISAVSTKDVLERLGPKISRKFGELTLARVTTVAVGLIATLLAVTVARSAIKSTLNIYDLLPRTFNMFLSPLASLFIIGMFVTRARDRTVLLAVSVCMGFSFFWSWWSEIPVWLNALGLDSLAGQWIQILGVDANGLPKRPTIMLAVAAPCILGVSLGALLSLFESNGDNPGRKFTWWATMRKAPLTAPETVTTGAAPEGGHIVER